MSCALLKWPMLASDLSAFSKDAPDLISTSIMTESSRREVASCIAPLRYRIEESRYFVPLPYLSPIRHINHIRSRGPLTRVSLALALSTFCACTCRQVKQSSNATTYFNNDAMVRRKIRQTGDTLRGGTMLAVRNTNKMNMVNSSRAQGHETVI